MWLVAYNSLQLQFALAYARSRRCSLNDAVDKIAPAFRAQYGWMLMHQAHHLKQVN